MTEGFIPFKQFYQAVHGRTPYVWQETLATQIWEDKSWPEQISAAAGYGKTSTIDVAVWLLAKDIHDHGIENRTFPLRIFFTVERRLVVDAAADHAQKIANSVENRKELYQVKEAFCRLIPPNEAYPPLGVASLHGGRAREFDWLRPFGAQIITCTVTQLASRTLFRGVGVSPGTLPIHAALAGMDRLILVDEPHLAPASVSMWRETENLQKLYPSSPRVGFTCILGATIPKYLESDRRFEASLEGDPSDFAKQLIRTSKHTKIVTSTQENDTKNKICRLAMAEYANRDLAGGHGVLVIVNTVSMAQEIYKFLKDHGKVEDDNLTLLVSTIRPIDRSQFDFGPDSLIVATQTVEVGVDIDACSLITELAPMPSLKQRVGRFNRSGNRSYRTAYIVAQLQDDSPNSAASKAIYGDKALTHTWNYLKQFDDDIADFNILEVPPDTWPKKPRIVSIEEFLPRLTSTRPPALVPWEAIAFGPDERTDLTVEVAWRDNLEKIETSPILALEKVTLPINSLKSFLSSAKGNVSNFADTESFSSGLSRNSVVSVDCRILRSDQWIKPNKCSDIVPGDLIVIASCEGGYDSRIGWDPSCEDAVQDASVRSVVSLGRGTFDASLILPQSKIDRYLEEDLDFSEVIAEVLDIDKEQFDLKVVGSQVHLQQTYSFGTQTRAVRLADHSKQVAEQAKESAELCGIDPQLLEAFYMAGLYHDAGKADPYFQSVLRSLGQEPLAKSALGNRGDDNLRSRRWRHEVLSAASLPEGLDHLELIKYLVMTHHGWARRVTDHDGSFILNHKRYFALESQYGPWGLALLETILRTADWRASQAPRSFNSEQWSSLNITLSKLEYGGKFESGNRDVFRVTGSPDHELTSIFAAIGALHSCVLQGDDSACLRFTDSFPEILSSFKPLWDVRFWNNIFYSMEIGAGIKHKSDRHGRPVDHYSEEPRMVRKGNKWLFEFKTAALEQCPDASPLFFDAYPIPLEKNSEKTQSLFFTVPVWLRNGNPFKVLGGSRPSVNWESFGKKRNASLLDVPTFTHGKMTGGLDMPKDDVSIEESDYRYSEDLLAWAIAGMIALGMPGTEKGVGVSGAYLRVPLPDKWVTLGELHDLFICPIPSCPSARWVSSHTIKFDKGGLWEAIH